MFRGLRALPTCVPPYYETTVGSGVFTDTVDGGRSCNPCAQGMRWSVVAEDCVLDTAPSPPTDGTVGGIDMKYIIIGVGVLLLLGAFAGGRASKKSGSKLLSRTTTRSIFG